MNFEIWALSNNMNSLPKFESIKRRFTRENHVLLAVNCVFIFDGRPITHRTYLLLIFLHIHIYYMLKHS